jgi:hypothetical protein
MEVIFRKDMRVTVTDRHYDKKSYRKQIRRIESDGLRAPRVVFTDDTDFDPRFETMKFLDLAFDDTGWMDAGGECTECKESHLAFKPSFHSITILSLDVRCRVCGHKRTWEIFG